MYKAPKIERKIYWKKLMPLFWKWNLFMYVTHEDQIHLCTSSWEYPTIILTKYRVSWMIESSKKKNSISLVVYRIIMILNIFGKSDIIHAWREVCIYLTRGYYYENGRIHISISVNSNSLIDWQLFSVPDRKGGFIRSKVEVLWIIEVPNYYVRGNYYEYFEW